MTNTPHGQVPAIQRYMPPDGPDAKDTLSEIIAIVDPWPLGPLEK